MPKATSYQLAERRGRSITKTNAMKTYKLQAGDFVTILPIIRRPNTYDHGKTEMLIYNEIDVAALAMSLKEATSGAAQATSSQGSQVNQEEVQLAPRKGRQIVRTEAIKKYRLTKLQIDRLTPTEIRENPHNRRSPPMRLYNEDDVKALSEQIHGEIASTTPAESPSKRQRPSPYNTPRKVIQRVRNFEEEDLYGGPGRYDGMDADDAAALFASDLRRCGV